MTLRTTSATRLTVVSRSSDVASTSATSSSKDSTGKRSGLEMTEPIARIIAAAFPVLPPGTPPTVLEADRGSVALNLKPSPRRTRSHTKKASVDQVLCDTSCPSWFMVLFSRHNANIGEIAIFLSVVQPVANHEFVRNLE